MSGPVKSSLFSVEHLLISADPFSAQAVVDAFLGCQAW